MMLKTKRLLFLPALFLLVFFLLVNQCWAAAKYKRSLEQYKVPDVTLVNQEGKQINFKEFLETDKVVILDFIYGT